MDGTGVQERLARLRGDAAVRPHTARTIAALTANPGCARRGLVDAAGVDKDGLAGALGFPSGGGRSQFAITRENGFLAIVRDDGCAALRDLLTARLGLACTGYRDLAGAPPRSPADGLLLDRPGLTLDIAGAPTPLDPDVLVLAAGGLLHVIMIKSFAVVDGQAAPDQVAAAARQAAVYVLALRAHGPVAPEVVLVCPENFANRPVASRVDVRRQLSVIERQLARLTRIADLLDGVPDAPLAEAVPAVAARYAPECLSSCELAYFCRSEARGRAATGALGRSLHDEVGGVDAVPTALGLADGSIPPGPGQAEIAARLRAAHALRLEVLGG